jgi:hypothetical protein
VIWLILTLACNEALEDGDGDGYAPIYGDCNDQEDAIHPEATELCDEIDNDCDGVVDGPDAEDATSWFLDPDGDGWGSVEVRTCEQPSGTVSAGGDCDDDDSGRHPEAEEVCDGLDQDCDDLIDEGLASTWFMDLDGDGYGSDEAQVEDCDQPPGSVTEGGDCDDDDAQIHPDATEVPGDGVDSDCDGEDA